MKTITATKDQLSALIQFRYFNLERMNIKNGTGKKFRNMQMWSTRYECKSADGSYYMVTIPDGNGNCFLQEGSDL